MATKHRHSVDSQDRYHQTTAQLEAVINLMACGSQAEDGMCHDDSIPVACQLAAELLSRLHSLFDERAAQ